MKNQKGITLISLVIYIILAIAIIATLAMLGKYFTSNVAEISEDSVGLAEMDVLNSYLLKDVKEKGNKVTNNQRLPVEYQEVEYIESTGTQYIDTGINATPTTSIKVELMLTSSTQQQRFFGTQGKGLVYCMYINGSNKIAVAFRDDSGDWLSLEKPFSKNVKYIFELNAINKMSYFCSEDGTVLGSARLTGTATKNSSDDLMLLASINGKVQQFCSGRLYSAEIKQDNDVIRNFVPCYKKSNEKPGLYDIENNRFYTNPGTGDFIAGPDIKSENNKLEFANDTKYYFNASDKCIYYEKNNSEFKLLNEVDDCEFNIKSENSKTIIEAIVTIKGKQIKREYVLGEENTYQDYITEVATKKTYEKKLPQEYQRVEYIESTGTQYIDTGVTSGSDVSAYFDAFFSTAQTARAIFGTGGDNGWGLYCGNGAFWDNYNDDTSTGVGNSVVGHFIVNKNKNTTNIKVYDTSGAQIKNTSTTHNDSTFSYSQNIYVFYKNGTSRSKGIFKLYSFKLWQSNTLVRDFVPCYRKADNVVGMYDMVNDVFYTNSGTGTFGTGPKVIEDEDEEVAEVLPNTYQQVTYIESTGTQYIQLPFGFDNKDEIEFKFSINSTYSTDSYMVAPQTWNNNNNRFAMGVHSGGKYTAAYGNASTGNTILSPNTTNDGEMHIWKYKDYKYTITDLNLSKDCSSISFGGTTANLKLFYGYNANKKGKISYYYHKKSDGTEYKLIPCYRKSDNVIGMYDIVNDVFYTNSGTGEFLKGPDYIEIPDEYQRVEYIESTGTQYIDTGYVPKNTTGIKVKINTKGSSYSSNNILGCRVNGSQRFAIGVSGSVWACCFNSSNNTTITYDNSRTNIIKMNYLNDRKMTIDNSSIEYNISATLTSTLPTIALFAQHDSSSGFMKYSYILYEVEITEAQNIVRKYIPCYRKSDNVIGMYDILNNVFYTNNGTGTFIAGPDISE